MKRYAITKVHYTYKGKDPEFIETVDMILDNETSPYTQQQLFNLIENHHQIYAAALNPKKGIWQIFYEHPAFFHNVDGEVFFKIDKDNLARDNAGENLIAEFQETLLRGYKKNLE